MNTASTDNDIEKTLESWLTDYADDPEGFNLSELVSGIVQLVRTGTWED